MLVLVKKNQGSKEMQWLENISKEGMRVGQ